MLVWRLFLLYGALDTDSSQFGHGLIAIKEDAKIFLNFLFHLFKFHFQKVEWWKLLKEVELDQASTKAPSTRQGSWNPSHTSGNESGGCPEMILETWLLWTTYEWHMWLWTATMKTSVSQKTLCMHIYHVLAHLGHTSAKSASKMNSCNILFTTENQVCLILNLCPVSKWG